MKHKHRSASLAPIFFLMLALLLWLHKEWSQGKESQGQSISSSASGANGDLKSEVSPLDSTSVNRSSSDHNAAPFWSISSTPAGEAHGLRQAFAAASRGRNELPEGRRWKVENFPDLRTLKEGQRVSVPLPDGRSMEGEVLWSKLDKGYTDTHMVSIRFDDVRGGLVAIHDGVKKRNQGRLIILEEIIAWTFNEADSDPVWLRERLRSDLICELPMAASRSNPLPDDPTVSPSSIPDDMLVPQPQLNSRPEAVGVLYLDFDGDEETIYPDWTPFMPVDLVKIDRSNLNTEQITKVWRRVAEDFIQFQVNVTTDPAKYAAAPVGKRMRVIIGYDHPAGIDGPGWALPRSFQPNSVSGMSYASDIPCFVEVQSYGNPTAGMNDRQFSSLASNISHEIGHTMGLAHDGWVGPPAEGYYKGHGTYPVEWGSIMGYPYLNTGGTESKDILQWAKDEYLGADNPQDDLAILAGPENDIGYAADESTGIGNASQLTTVGANVVGGEGIIANQTDQDWWRFTVTHQSTVSIEVTPADMAVSLANLDCQFSIQDASGTELAGGPYDAVNNLEAAATASLTPGTYYIVVSGQGNGGGFPTASSPSLTGYSAYGSTGRYLVTINMPPDVVPPQVAVTSPAQGSELTSSPVNFQGTVTDNGSIAGVSLFLRRNSDGVYWNGFYWQVGSSGAALTYSLTGNQWVCTSTLPPVGGSSENAFRGGAYSFIAIGIDGAGLTTQSESVVTVDNTAPGVNVFTPASGSTMGVPGFTFTGNVTDDTNLNYVVGYIRRNADNFYWNGSSWQSGASGANLTCTLTPVPPTTVSNWTCTAPLPSLGSSLTPGSYNFIAIAVDNVGNQRQVDSVVSVDSIAPVTTLAAPAPNSIINSGSVPFHGSITDNAGVWRVVCFIRRHTDNLYWNGSAWIADPGAANLSTSYNAGNNSWTCTATLPQPGGTLENGGYNFIALGFDHAGNVHQVDSVVTVDFHQTYVWNGSGGSDWDIATSWTPNGIPGADDYVLINNGGTVNNHAIRSVYGFRAVNGTITSSTGNSLTFTNDSTWTGGTITGVWNNANGGTIVLNQLPAQTLQAGAVLQNSGLLRNNAGTSTISNAVQQLSGGRILNNGTNIYLSGGGEHQTGSVLEANTGAIYLSGGTHTFLGGSFAGNNWTYCSAGTMLVQGNVGPSTGTASGKFGIAGGTVTGSGTVSARDGYFSTGSMNGSVVLRFTNTFTKPTNTTLNMNGGTLQSEGLFESPGGADFNLDSASGGGAGTIINKGTWRTSNAFTYSNGSGGGVFRNDGLFESLAGVSMIAAAFHSEPGSTFRSKSGYVRLGGGGIHKTDSTFHADGGDIYLSAGTHQFLGGTFTGPRYVYATGATVSVEGNVGASSGSATGGFGIFAGTVTGTSMLSVERCIFQEGAIGGSVTIRLTGESSKVASSVLSMNGGTIRNDGTFTGAGAGDINLDSAAGGGAGTILNKGTWRTNDAFTYSNGSGGGVFRNEGLFESLAGVSMIAGAFHSEAGSTFRSKSGYVRLSGGGIHQLGSTFDADGGDIYFSAGTHQLFGGTLIGSRFLYATGGTTSVEGNVGASSGAATGGFAIAGGTVTGTAILSAERGSLREGAVGGTVTIRLTGESNKVTNSVLNMNGGTIRNEGTMSQPASADINLDSSSSAGAGTLVNTGTWNVTGSSNITNGSDGGMIENYGLWHISAGNSTNYAYFTHHPDSIFRVTGGQMIFIGGGSMKPGSTIDTSGGPLYLNGGTQTLEGGSITGASTVYCGAGTSVVTGNVGTTSGAATGGFGIYSAGRVIGTGMLSADHGYLAAGSMAGTVTLRFTGISQKITSTVLTMNGGIIRNEGIMNQATSGDFNLDSDVSTGAGTIINTGTWNQTGGSNFTNGSNAGIIENYGLWNVSAGTTNNYAYFTHHPDSIFRGTAGSVLFLGGSRMKAGSTLDANGGYFYLSTGAHTLEGGTITGNTSVYSSNGTTTVTGDVGNTTDAATGGFGITGGTVNGTSMLSAERGYLGNGSMGGTVTLRYTGASTKATSTVLNMNGGTIRNEGTMNQAASGDFNLDSSASAGAGTLINTGTWNQTGGSNFTNGSDAGMIENYGLWDISAGNSTNHAYFTHHQDSIFRITGGQMIFVGGSRLKAGATLEANGGYLYFSTGTHTLEGGTITGITNIYTNAGTTTVTGDVGNTTGAATGGYGIIGGTLTGSAMLSVERGYIANGSIGGTVTLRMTGASTKLASTVLDMNGGTILNEGTMTVAASSDFNLDSSSSAGAGTIINTGTWINTGSCNFTNSSLNGSLQNSGTFEITAGTTQVYAPFSNSGITRVTAGSLFLRAGSTHTGGLVSNGSLTFIGSGHSFSGSNAFLGGSGSVSGNATLTNAARIAPGNSPGTLSLFGTMQFIASTEAPAILMELASASQFDQIVLGNGASLALGTGITDLQLELQYRPTPGQTFRIISAGTSTGTFSGRFRNAATTGSVIAATYQGIPYQFRVNYDPSSKFIDLVYQSGYQLWTSQMGLIGSDGDFDADPDGDGIANGIEFIIGGDPRPGFPDSIPHPNQNNPVLDETHLIFTHRRTHVSRYLPTVVQYNSSLAPTWNNSQQGVNGVIITVTENFYGVGIDQVETKIPRVLAVEGRIFVRLYSEE